MKNMNMQKIVKADNNRSFWHRPRAASVLKALARNLESELNSNLERFAKKAYPLSIMKACFTAMDNLSNVKVAVEEVLQRKDLVIEGVAFLLIDSQTEQTEAILHSGILSESNHATRIAIRTLNHLFYAKQKLKQKFSVKTEIEIPQSQNEKQAQIASPDKQKILPAPDLTKNTLRMIIPSVLLYQIYHSLFPAEKMLVGAGQRRNGTEIEINAVFDVTGEASHVGVRANAGRLSRALISMSETDNYFALWIHSHPGRGHGATHPSSIDRNQETDWLRDYSANLVSAIMVEDRFIRFWGKALEEKRVAVEINGPGVRKEKGYENIYKLES